MRKPDICIAKQCNETKITRSRLSLNAKRLVRTKIDHSSLDESGCRRTRLYLNHVGLFLVRSRALKEELMEAHIGPRERAVLEKFQYPGSPAHMPCLHDLGSIAILLQTPSYSEAMALCASDVNNRAMMRSVNGGSGRCCCKTSHDRVWPVLSKRKSAKPMSACARRFKIAFAKQWRKVISLCWCLKCLPRFTMEKHHDF